MVDPLEMYLVIQSSSSMALIAYIPPAEAEDNHYQKLIKKVPIESHRKPASLHRIRGAAFSHRAR